MPDLAGRGPLGPKPPKTPRKPPKAIPKQSAKRKSYRASAARVDAVAHMLAVKALRCICCDAPQPSEAHHCCDDGPRDDLMVIPLCIACHRGPDGYHGAKKSWRARYGRDVDLLPRVAAMLASCPTA